MSGVVGARERDAVRSRLEAYRVARADIAAAVREAHALGLGPVEIAALSGLTRQGVRKILNRANDDAAPAWPGASGSAGAAAPGG